jgi:hypothetical protein
LDVTSNPHHSLSGELYAAVLANAVPIALLVSLALLRIYRRAVMRSMRQRVTPGATAGLAGAPENGPTRSGEPPGHSLEIMPHDPPADDVRFAVRRATWPSAAVQACAGLAYAIVMASLDAAWLGFIWQRFLFITIGFAWPMVITVGLAIAVSWRGYAMLVVGYALALAGASAPALVFTNTIGQLLTTWLLINGPGTLLAFAFLARPIRAVGSLVLVFMIAAVGGAVFAVDFCNQSDQVFNWFYLGIRVVGALLSLAGVVTAGIIGWLLLRSRVTGVTTGQLLTNRLNANATGRFRGVTLARPLSALAVALTIAAVGGAIVVLPFFETGEPQTFLLATIINFVGVVGGIVLMLLIGVIPTGIIGWLLLRWIGSLYRERRISDQSIMIDAVWLMFSFIQSALAASVSGRKAMSGAIVIGAFVAYKLVATAGFRLLRALAEKDTPSSRLLLLRVFSLGSRSERLFAGFTKLWRHMGSVRMIAGPDLATSTVEPHEFLDFVAGRLQRRFITDPDTLEQRLRETEQGRDVDGRFRVADFFCHDDTWQMTLRRLEKDSDVVLMDLRGFSQSNRGCVFEIHELLDVVPLHHIVFVVDRTTDEHFVAQVFADAWALVTKASPNWNDPAPRVRLYHFDGHVGQDIPALVAVIASAGIHNPMRNEAQETSQRS